MTIVLALLLIAAVIWLTSSLRARVSSSGARASTSEHARALRALDPAAPPPRRTRSR